MRSLKRMLALAGLTGMLAALAIAAPAQAAGVKAVCITTGIAKTNPPVGIIGGKGSYTFSNLVFVCAGVEKLTNPAVVQFDVNSQGVYKNIVCGTGKAINTSNAVNTQTTLLGTPKTDFAALATSGVLKYDVEFAALNGVLFWHDPNASKLPPGLVPKPLPDPKGVNTKPNGNPGGYVLILPDPTKAFAPCTKAFRVVAVALIDTENIPF